MDVIIGMWIMFGLGCLSGFWWSRSTQYSRFSKEYNQIAEEWRELGTEYKRMKELNKVMQDE